MHDTSHPTGQETTGAITDADPAASRLLVTLSARSIAAVDETITTAEFRVLVVLDTRGPLCAAALAYYLALRLPTATRMVERLVQAGLLSREPTKTSRRGASIELTTRGRGVVGEVTDHRRREIGAVVEHLPGGHRSWPALALDACTENGDDPGVLASAEVYWV
ncbi:MarR family transcriptional regulator (plasmid) [Rhodococcus opacus]|uniref:MarR family winged helix-turn-helix transcriptional regulator n=1 Tax=Rhodococcus opacus TaxID=37919 RepID=UPI0034D25C93